MEVTNGNSRLMDWKDLTDREDRACHPKNLKRNGYDEHLNIRFYRSVEDRGHAPIEVRDGILRARQICLGNFEMGISGCVIQKECLEYAEATQNLSTNSREYGVWGGVEFAESRLRTRKMQERFEQELALARNGFLDAKACARLTILNKERAERNGESQ